MEDQAKANTANALMASHAQHKPRRHRANLIQGLRLAQIKAIKPTPDTPATHADAQAGGNAPAPVCQNTPHNQAPAQTSHTPIARHPHFLCCHLYQWLRHCMDRIKWRQAPR